MSFFKHNGDNFHTQWPPEKLVQLEKDAKRKGLDYEAYKDYHEQAVRAHCNSVPLLQTDFGIAARMDNLFHEGGSNPLEPNHLSTTLKSRDGRLLATHVHDHYPKDGPPTVKTSPAWHIRDPEVVLPGPNKTEDYEFPVNNEEVTWMKQAQYNVHGEREDRQELEQEAWNRARDRSPRRDQYPASSDNRGRRDGYGGRDHHGKSRYAHERDTEEERRDHRDKEHRDKERRGRDHRDGDHRDGGRRDGDHRGRDRRDRERQDWDWNIGSSGGPSQAKDESRAPDRDRHGRRYH